MVTSESEYHDATSSNDLGYNGISVSMNYFTGIPDPSIFQDPNSTVLFRSLAKRDSTTKEKALNDLKNEIISERIPSNELDTFVSSWIQMYSKLATDEAKSVRLNSHLVQGELLNSLGGKNFSKYLKSCLPIWIHGIFDNESIVADGAARTLLNSFQNDAEKVNHKIWLIFAEQIINFIHLNIIFETPATLSNPKYTKEEDMNSKYERVLNGCLMMLIKIIQLVDSSDLKISDRDDLKIKIEETLKSETLWDYLSVVNKDETFNGPLFKSMMILIKTIFVTKGPSANILAQNINDLKGMYKLISKKFIKNVTFKSLKQKIVLSNLILQFWDTLNVLTQVSSHEGFKSLKIKKNFWEYGGNKSKSRCITYLKLGNCQSNPIYYSILEKFLVNLSNVCKENDTLKVDFDLFSNNKTAELILIDILCIDLTKLSNWSFKEKAIMCITKSLHALVRSEDPDSQYLMLKILRLCFDSLSIKVVGASGNKGKKSTINIFSDVINDNFSQHLEKIFISLSEFIFESQNLNQKEQKMITYIHVLSRLKRVDEIQHLAHRILENLNTNENEDGKSLIFLLFINLFELKVHLEGDEVSTFLMEIATFIEADFIDEPLKLLQEVLKTEKYHLDTAELVNDCFMKISMVRRDKLRDYFSIISSMQIKLRDDSDMFKYLKEVSEKDEHTDEELSILYSFFSEKVVFDNLLDVASKSERHSIEFMKNCIKHDVDMTSMNENKALEKIIRYSLSNITHPEALEFINFIKKFNLRTESIVYDLVINSDVFYNFTPLIETVNKNWLPLKRFRDVSSAAFGRMNLSCLSISNSIEQNSMLFMGPRKDYNVDGSVVSIANFILSFTSACEDIDEEIIIFCGELGEYLNDYLFFSPHTDTSIIDAILKLKTGLTNGFIKFGGNLDSSSLSVVYNNIGDEELREKLSESEKLYSKLLSSLDPENEQSYYTARLLKTWTERMVEYMTMKDFEEMNININKLTSNYPALTVLLCSSSIFSSESKKFDRAKNYLVSELLSKNDPDQITSKGLRNLTLVNNFSNQEKEFVPPHKLSMLISQLRAWLESENSYDEIFVPIRIQLCILFSGLLLTQSIVNENLVDISLELLSDNMSMIQLMPDTIELRYFSYRLYNVMISRKNDYFQTWTNKSIELEDNFVESLFNSDVQSCDEEKRNQAVNLTQQLAFRIIPKLKLQETSLEQILKSVYKTFAETKFTVLQRIAVYIIRKYVLASQQEFVLEYQLAKTAVNDNATSATELTLPDTLLEIVRNVDHVEEEEEISVSRYLWAWFLVFSFCSDMPYSMQQEYIEILQTNENTIHELLNFVFEYSTSGLLAGVIKSVGGKVNLGTKKEHFSVNKYDLKDEHIFESFDNEMRFLSIHLLYLSFLQFGSQVQSWFNSLRDKQLKSKIEEFAIKFISPLIISSLLNDVYQTKQKLTAENENLSIKVAETINEIRCIYQVDEQKMEVVIKIPSNYPINNVTVEGPSRLGVKPNHWRAWLLASQRIISLNNGSISEAIELFSKNVNLHFSGFEDCAICYSILHQDKSLPSKICPTCQNKFHAACLYKWFKSSGGSTCPLCRASFTFKSTKNEL